MRAALFIIFTLASLYAAGLYRSFSLLALFSVDVIVLIVMIVMAARASLSTSIRFASDAVFLHKGVSGACTMIISNKSMLKIGKIAVTLEYGYGNGKLYRTKLFGETGTDNSEVSFSVEPLYSGVIYVMLIYLSTFDPLGFFSVRRKVCGECMAYVLPEFDIRGVLSEREASEELSGKKTTAPLSRGEVAKVREYAPGDAARYIHWNRYAMTDDVWVKEFEDDRDEIVRIFVDTAGADSASPREAGELLDRAVQATGRVLASSGGAIIVCAGRDGETEQKAVYGEEELREAFVMLADAAAGGLSLNTDLDRREKDICISL